MSNAISFFTGAGGLDLGIEEAGFDVKLSVEIDRVCCETLRSNNESMNVYEGDIQNLSKDDVLRIAGLDESDEVDLVFGGSPCQSFSTAGRRQAFEDPRGGAMLKFADLVNDIRPKAFLLENVRGLLSAALRHRPIDQRGNVHSPLDDDEQRGSAFEYLLSRIEGYRIEYALLNAADYGVPQKRQRVFIIGIRDDLNREFEFPQPTHNEMGTDGMKHWVTFTDVLSSMNDVEHIHQRYSEDRLRWMRLIPQGGGNWRDLAPHGEDVVREAMGGAYNSGGGKVGFYRRVKLDQPTPTLLTSPSQKSTNLGHPIEDRPLSIQEYIAIQEFPSEYVLEGSLMDRYKQVGNAVPIRLAKVLGEKIMQTIQQES